jgi:cysteine-rich repeat protein
VGYNDTGSAVCACQNGYAMSDVTSKCKEICGDGKLFELNCDDNNTIDGDGCSSTCQI